MFELPQGYDGYFKKWEDKIGAFIEFFPAGLGAADAAGDSALKGLPFAIKDNIALEGVSFSCGSKLLENFKAPYTATAVQKLIASGCVPIGKTNLDEFGMGSSTDNSAIKKTNNPWDAARVAGGSSGGSAAAVAAGLVPFALGSDTGGSIRQPAALCGVVGLKPTYGAVSRYGLVSYASSLECIGVLADSSLRCRKAFDIIRGSDPLDQTSKDAPAAAGSAIGIIGVLPPEALAATMIEDEVRKGFETAKANLAALGFAVREVDIPGLKYAAPAYHTIAAAEASANLARFDGIRYGQRPVCAADYENFVGTARGAGLGSEVKLRILLGTFVLRSGFQERYYLRAQRIRAGIRRNFEALLGDGKYSNTAGKCDALLLPVFPARAFNRGPGSLSPFAQKAADLYTCCANLAGLPALSFPASVEGGLPIGVQLIGRAFAEGALLDIAQEYENAHPLPHPQGYKNFWGRA